MIGSLLLVLLLLGPTELHAKPKATVPAAAPTAGTDDSAAPVPVGVTPPDLTLDRSDGQALTLEGSVRMAIQGATTVLKAENTANDYATRLLQAYGQFLPNLVGSGSYNTMNGTTYLTTGAPTLVTGTSQNASFALAADLNLFNGLSDISQLKSSLLRKEASDLTVTRAKQQISLDITQSFLQVVLDKKLVAIAQKNLQASQERERLLQEQTEVGARNLADLFRQQAQTSLDESYLLSAQNKGRNDQITLLRKLRVDLASRYHFVEPSLVEEGMAPESLNEDVLVSEGLEKRLDFKASRQTADAGEWDVHSAFSGYLPKIDLVAGMISVGHYLDNQTANGVNVVPGSQTAILPQLGPQIQYTIGLNLTWNLFDRFLTAENVTHARVISDNAKIDAEDRKLQVQGEVRKAYGDYLTSLQQLQSSKKGLEAAQKAYEVMDGRYGVGSASFLDLITAQSTLVEAQSERAQSLINFQLQDKSLEYAVGTLKVD